MPELPRGPRKNRGLQIPWQRTTKNANNRRPGAVELVLLLPGRYAAQVRRQAAELLVRYLGGDLRIIQEVCVLRGLQEELT